MINPQAEVTHEATRKDRNLLKQQCGCCNFGVYSVVTINAPIDVVWKVITTPSKFSEWNPFQTKCESTMKVGDKFKMEVQLDKPPAKPMAVEEIIREVNKDEYFFSYGLDSMLMKSARNQTLTKLGDGCTRYHSADLIWGPCVCLAKLYRGKMQRGFDDQAAALAAYCERVHAQQD